MYLKRTSSWIFYFIRNFKREKLILRKVKYTFWNADADVNADAGTKIQVQKTECEYYSQNLLTFSKNILKLLNSIRI